MTLSGHPPTYERSAKAQDDTGHVTYISSSNSLPINPRRNCTRLPPCVRQLNRNLLTLTMRKVDRLLQRFNLTILPQPRIMWRDPPLRRHSRSFDYRETRATLDDAAEMCLVPHGVVAVLG